MGIVVLLKEGKLVEKKAGERDTLLFPQTERKKTVCMYSQRLYFAAEPDRKLRIGEEPRFVFHQRTTTQVTWLPT